MFDVETALVVNAKLVILGRLEFQIFFTCSQSWQRPDWKILLGTFSGSLQKPKCVNGGLIPKTEEYHLCGNHCINPYQAFWEFRNI